MRTPRYFRTAALAMGAVAALGACKKDGEVVNLSIQMHGPDDDGDNVNPSFPEGTSAVVETITLTSYKGYRVVNSRTVAWDAEETTMPAIGSGSDLWVSVQGFIEGNDRPNASGATRRFSGSPGNVPARLDMLTADNNDFLPAFTFDSSDEVSVEATYELPSEARIGQAVAVLPDGSGLIVSGGVDTDLRTTDDYTNVEFNDTIEWYNADIGQFVAVFDDDCSDDDCALRLSRGRAFHTATALPDGRILIVGGLVKGPDGVEGSPDAFILTLTSAGYGYLDQIPTELELDRAFHTATLTADRVVIAGGSSRYPDLLLPDEIEEFRLDSDEIIDSGARLDRPRAFHTATNFNAGAHGIIVVGGLGRDGSTSEVLRQSEVIFTGGDGDLGVDVVGTGEDDVDLATARYGHSAAVVSCPKDGAEYLVIAGGFTSTGLTPLVGTGVAMDIEVYDPSRIAVDEAYQFLPPYEEERRTLVTGRAFATVVSLPITRDLLIAGGLDAAGNIVGSFERHAQDWGACPSYIGLADMNIDDDFVSPNPGEITTPRAFAASVMLGNGFLFMTGGSNGTTGVSQSEFYNPNDYYLIPALFP